MSLNIAHVSWRQGGCLVLDGVSLHITSGAVLGLIGPNGSGKSSLLRLLAGLGTPSAGRITLEGQPLADYRRRDVARRLALVEQHASTEIDIDVQGIVALGRTPHRTALRGDSSADRQVVEQALAQAGLLALRTRRWHSLSGGERQRVQIARALAQQPSELLLDEPTNHLDIQHQLELLQLVRDLPMTCIMALHDLNLAAMFCDQVAVLHQGRLVAFGTPVEVLNEQLIGQVYGVNAQVQIDQGQVHVRYRR